MKPRSFQTRIISYKKDKLYLGVALDFDLLVQGASMGKVMERLDDCITSYLIECVNDNEKEEDIYRRAPKKYFDIYELFLDLEKKAKSKEVEKYKDKFLGTRTFSEKSLANV